MTHRGSTIGHTRALLRKNERGVALPMVLVVFLVGFALVTAFLVSIVGSAQVSNTTRSGIQAQAAAEAGIAAIQALPAETDPCSFNFASLSRAAQNPSYNITVTDATRCSATEQPSITLNSVGIALDGQTTAAIEVKLAVAPGSSGGTAQGGNYPAVFTGSGSGGELIFPLVSDVENTKSDYLVVSGTARCKATVNGRVGTDSGDTDIAQGCTVSGDVWATKNMRIEGTVTGNVYLISDAATQIEITSNGRVNGNIYTTAKEAKIQGLVTGDIYQYPSAGVSGSTFYSDKLITGNVSTTAASVEINSGGITGSLTHARENSTRLYIGAAVRGSVWTTASKLSIRADIGASAAKVSVTQNSAANATMELANNAVLYGDLWVSGSATIQDTRVDGNVTIAGTAVSTVAPSTARRIEGSLRSAGSISTWGGSGTAQQQLESFPAVRGSVDIGVTVPKDKTNPSMLALPEQPVGPGWLDYEYRAADWSGFTPENTLNMKTIGACNLQNTGDAQTAVLAKLASNSGKVVLDARTCESAFHFYGVTAQLNSDVLILLPASRGASFHNSKWNSSSAHTVWIVQNDTNVNGQPNCSGGKVNLTNIQMQSTITMGVYSPCQVILGGGAKFYGHVIGGSSNFNGTVEFTHRPVVFAGAAGKWAGGGSGNGTAVSPTSPSIAGVQQARNIQ